MTEKTTDQAYEELKAIKAELAEGVIKDHEMLTLCDINTCKDTGFIIILTLNTKYDYTSDVLDNWKNRLMADNYVIKVHCNQLEVRFNVSY
jgi:hypothetical protein